MKVGSKNSFQYLFDDVTEYMKVVIYTIAIVRSPEVNQVYQPSPRPHLI